MKICYWCQKNQQTGRHSEFCLQCYPKVHRTTLAELGITAREYGSLIEFVNAGIVVLTDQGLAQLAQVDKRRPLVEYNVV